MAKRVLLGFSFYLMLSSLALAAWDLDSVFKRADAALNVEWVADSANVFNAFYDTNSAKCTGSDTVYQHSDFIAGRTYKSIAYSYGGEDSDSVFMAKRDSGWALGSHSCHYYTFGDPTPAVGGTDCSGFIGWTWKTSRKSTGGFYDKYPKIPRDSMAAGDILVKPGSHMVMVREFVSVNEVLIVESTSAVNGVRQRVIDAEDGYWMGYTPLRNGDLREMPLSIASTGRDLTNQILIENRIVVFKQKHLGGAVFNAQAKVQKSFGPNSQILDLSALLPGVYWVQWADDNNGIHIQQFHIDL